MSIWTIAAEQAFSGGTSSGTPPPTPAESKGIWDAISATAPALVNSGVQLTGMLSPKIRENQLAIAQANAQAATANAAASQNQTNSKQWIWILVAVAAVILIMLMLRK